MPSTVRDLLEAAAVQASGVVPWGAPLHEHVPGGCTTGTGVYLVALTSELDSVNEAVPACRVSRRALKELLDACPGLTLDGGRPERNRLGKRLAAFWCPDEVVLYVGRAGPRERVKVTELADRVGEYYATSLGARSPHSGGWPLKTLADMKDLFVHSAYCDDVHRREGRMLAEFAQNVSEATRAQLFDSLHVMPFANLEFPKGVRKRHGIGRARVARERVA